jgi:glutaminyl-peptide cyclotransferase
LFLCALLFLTAGCSRAPETLTAEIIASRPHDPAAYTQGLQWHDGRLWESTGLYGQSSVREVDPATGEVLRKRDLPARYFGEGLTWHEGELWLLTWREQTAFVLDPDTFATKREHTYAGEGWGLTSDGEHLIMSDGTSRLRFMAPADFSLARELAVTENGVPLSNLNELEFIDGHIFANIYLTDRIVRIDPATGQVTASLDLSALRTQLPHPHNAEVLNGITHDPATGHLLVTGKRWPLLFEIKTGRQRL